MADSVSKDGLSGTSKKAIQGCQKGEMLQCFITGIGGASPGTQPLTTALLHHARDRCIKLCLCLTLKFIIRDMVKRAGKARSAKG